MASPIEFKPTAEQSELMQKVCGGGQELTLAEQAEACILVQKIAKLDQPGSFVNGMTVAMRKLNKSDPKSLEAQFLKNIFLTKCFGFIQSPGLASLAFADAEKDIPPFLLEHVLSAEQLHRECSEPTNSKAETVQKSEPVEVAECEALLKLAEKDGFSRGESSIHPTSSAEAAAKVAGIWDLLGEERAGRF